MQSAVRRLPFTLVLAAALVVLEATLLLVLTVLELLALNSERLTLGLTTAAFFALAGAGLLLCARGLWTRQSWARGPVMMAQLIQLGMAYSLFDRQAPWVSIALAGVAVLTAVGLLHPASLAAMSEEDATG